MESLNKTIKQHSFHNTDFNEKIKEKISDKFDLSIIGKIDLAEAEKIAQEEILFLTESELLEGLEDFELVPINKLKHKKYSDDFFSSETLLIDKQEHISNEETDSEINLDKENQQKEYDSVELEDLMIETAEAEPIEQLPDENLILDYDDTQTQELIEIISVDEKQQPSVFEKAEDSLFLEELSVQSEENADESFNEFQDECLINENQIDIIKPESEEFTIQNQLFVRDILDLREKTFLNLSKTNIYDINGKFIYHSFYRDFDIEFITSIIASADFNDFLNNIDYYTWPGRKYPKYLNLKLTEIYDETDFIHQKLFPGNILHPDNCSNILIKSDHYSENELYESEILSDELKESDKIIIEENIDDLHKYLTDYDNSANSNIQYLNSESTDRASENLQDITDRIIILEDKEKLQVFANQFPEKHQNLIKLLSYLDGLFEKLPEEVIHKFVESDYFELYSTLLQDIGE